MKIYGTNGQEEENKRTRDRRKMQVFSLKLKIFSNYFSEHVIELKLSNSEPSYLIMKAKKK